MSYSPSSEQPITISESDIDKYWKEKGENPAITISESDIDKYWKEKGENPAITISKSEIDLFWERKEKENNVLDLESGFVMGLPKRDTLFKHQFEAPDTPHTFIVDTIEVTVKDEKKYVIENVRVVFAHGGQFDGKWTFSDGKEVVKSVNKYNEDHSKDPIELVVSCHDLGDKDDEVRIGVSEFKDVAHVVGSIVEAGVMFRNNSPEVYMKVVVPKEGFAFNFDELDLKRKIKILD